MGPSTGFPAIRISHSWYKSALLAYVDVAFETRQPATLVAFKIPDAHFDLFIIEWLDVRMRYMPISKQSCVLLACSQPGSITERDAFQTFEVWLRAQDNAVEPFAGESGIKEINGAEVMGCEIEQLVLVEEVDEIKHLSCSFLFLGKD